MEVIIDEVLENLDLTKTLLPSKDFDNCTFKSCNFSGVTLSGVNFLDCSFELCNFSMAKLSATSFKDATFTGCKIIGVDFSNCNDLLLSFNFNACQLDYTFFFKKKMKKTRFKECSIKEANFTEADLEGSIFYKCDLTRTVFERSNLRLVDFRTATNYSIDPENNIVKKARFSLEGLPGLLEKYDIDIE